MKKYTFLITTIILLSSCHKFHDFNHPAPEFNKSYGGPDRESVFGIVRTIDGGYVLAGSTNIEIDGRASEKQHRSEAGNFSWLMKLDKNGNMLWQKSLGDGIPYSFTKRIGGGFAVAGYTFNSNVSGYHGRQADVWVITTDEDGNVLWQKAFGGSGFDIGLSIISTFDGGYVIAGATESTDGDVTNRTTKVPHADDAWILKLDMDGHIQWQKSFGGSGYDRANSIIASSDGGFVFTGFAASNDGDVSGNHGANDVWVVKLNNKGNKVWQKTFGGSGADFGSSLIYSGGGYVVAGSTLSTDGDVSGYHGGFSDAWVIKLNESGDKIWQKTFGGSGADNAGSITEGRDGGYLLVGNTQSSDVIGYHGYSDALIVRMDRNGNKQWEKALGGTLDESVGFVITRPEGGYVMAGESTSNDGDVTSTHGNYDAWITTIKDRVQ